MFGNDELILETVQSVNLPTAGNICVQGGTNGHEDRSGDTNGSGARTFIKLDSEHGDADIRIVFWDQDGERHEFEALQAVSVSVGGGEESRTMASGIRALAALFESLGIQKSISERFQASMSDGESKRIDHQVYALEEEEYFQRREQEQ